MGGALAKYIQPLPLPGAGIVVATPSGINQYAFTQKQIMRQLHPDLPPTPFFAYDDGLGLAGQAGSFGMAIVAHSGTALDVSFTNALPLTYPSWIPVDTRLTPLGNQLRVMTHLHGGFVAGASDGNPPRETHQMASGSAIQRRAFNIQTNSRQRSCGSMITLWVQPA
jgi:spore coat protein A, manganese oxidase